MTYRVKHIESKFDKFDRPLYIRQALHFDDSDYSNKFLEYRYEYDDDANTVKVMTQKYIYFSEKKDNSHTVSYTEITVPNRNWPKSYKKTRTIYNFIFDILKKVLMHFKREN